MFLSDELEEMVEKTMNKDLLDENTSIRGVDWHLDHTYRVIISVSKLLVRSNPDEYKRDFNLSRSVVFMTNTIPRGKGRAPMSVITSDEITEESLKALHTKSTELLNEIKSLPAHCFFKHPIFGILDLEMSKQFIKIHTIHHLKIMREILKNNA